MRRELICDRLPVRLSGDRINRRDAKNPARRSRNQSVEREASRLRRGYGGQGSVRASRRDVGIGWGARGGVRKGNENAETRRAQRRNHSQLAGKFDYCSAERTQCSSLHSNSRNCSQAAKKFQKRHEPRNTRNTRNSEPARLSFRVFRVFRGYHFGCGFAFSAFFASLRFHSHSECLGRFPMGLPVPPRNAPRPTLSRPCLTN